MGAELVGMNGVISNVINILSVTELGISTAIVYHLYGALARKDEAEIASLMNLYRKAYHVFACLLYTSVSAVCWGFRSVSGNILWERYQPHMYSVAFAVISVWCLFFTR